MLTEFSPKPGQYGEQRDNGGLYQIGHHSGSWIQNPHRDVNLLSRVFAEEKVSELRDLMDEYLKRYRLNLFNNNELLKDTALKQWVNGAAFHVQMLIQLAHLDHRSSTSAQNAIDTYLEDLEQLLQAYKTLKKPTIKCVFKSKQECR
ncbi:hypothetical protein GN956_G22494 [Arapaima gigas]